MDDKNMVALVAIVCLLRAQKFGNDEVGPRSVEILLQRIIDLAEILNTHEE